MVCETDDQCDRTHYILTLWSNKISELMVTRDSV